MLTLALDTTSKSASAALVRDGSIVAEFLINADINHSETVMPAVSAVLEIAGTGLDEVDFFSFALGPGAFTGLRIGAGIIKGLALGTGKPVVGVSSLDALARNYCSDVQGALLCPMLDAKRDEVYTAVYERTAAGWTKVIADKVTGPREFLGQLQGSYAFLGDGTFRYEGLIRELLPGRHTLLPEALGHIRASAVGLLGLEEFSRGNVLDLVTFTPVYLRTSPAEKA